MKIAVLMGGASAEREVSLGTGEALAGALRECRHFVKTFDIKSISRHPERGGGDDVALTDIISEILKFDVVFLGLHGGFGENGGIQSLLEDIGIPYTGSGPLSSAIAMDKVISKKLFNVSGIRTPAWISLGTSDGADPVAISRKIEIPFGFPCVVKPADQGSTVGVSIIADSDGLARGLKEAFSYSDEVVIEEYIEGREITVAILGDKPLPVVEIIPKHGIYDYQCKYTEGMSEYVVPAEIPPEIGEEAKSQAVMAFKVLRCRDYARVDFRLGVSGKTFCLEVNSLPGMTSTSLVPKAARASGIDFPELADSIVRIALERSQEKG